MKKYLGFIFIPFFALLLMSHNAAAFQITESVQNRVSISAPYWKYRSNSTWSSNRNTSISRSPNDATITGINLSSSTSSSVQVYQGEYIVMHGWITFNELSHGSEYFNIAGYLGISAASETKNCTIINWDALYQEYWATQGIERYNFDVTCRVLNDTNSPVLNFYTRSNVSGASGTDPVMSMNITGWDVYEVTGDIAQQEKQSSDNIENQSPSDVGSSDNSGTTNLINALGGFITTIANAPATNCLINGDLGNLDVGSINLCSGKENFNTLVEFIGFTALFGVVFWAAYHLVKRTLSLIDWARSK